MLPRGYLLNDVAADDDGDRRRHLHAGPHFARPAPEAQGRPTQEQR